MPKIPTKFILALKQCLVSPVPILTKDTITQLHYAISHTGCRVCSSATNRGNTNVASAVTQNRCMWTQGGWLLYVYRLDVFFDVLLTVQHLSIILVINQISAQNFVLK